MAKRADINRHCTPRWNTSHGFTFIEMIVSLALMATLAAIFGMGLVAAMQSFSFSRANAEVVQTGQMAMARMERELTEITAINGAGSDSTGTYIVYDRVVPVKPSSEDTGELVSYETVTYCLQFQSASNQILLFTNLPPGTIAPPDTGGDLLSQKVETLTFRFFQGGGIVWTPASDITLLSTIEIELALIRPDNPDPAKAHQFKTLVHLRNTPNLGGAL